MNNQAIAHWRKKDNTAHLLREHLSDVSILSSSFAAKLHISVAGELIGLLHDLGKYSQEFQNYIQSAVGLKNYDEDDYVDANLQKGKIDHSSAGAQYIWQALSSKGKIESLIAQIFALCIASHHSGLIDCLDLEGEDTFTRRMDKTKEKTHLDEVNEKADSEIIERAKLLLEKPELITELRNLIAKICEKNRETYRNRNRNASQQIGLAVRFLFSCLIDADRIDSADFEHKDVKNYRPKSNYIAWGELIERLENKLVSMTPARPIDHLRQDISQHCLDASSRSGGVYTLTVPTGGGKTLASLRFALHHVQKRKLDRIFYIIPFTSIIEQNAKVVREILEPHVTTDKGSKIVLEHHGNVTPEQQTWREKVLCESWDAPIIYTTMVQFLETLFGAGTRSARRMHQLSNSVLVFDEIQTLPIKCTHLFNNAINFLVEQCNSTVVLCTATQPLLHKVEKEKGAIRLATEHEIMPDVQRFFVALKRVEVKDQRKSGGWKSSNIAQLAVNEIIRAGSCLVIVNTKAAAKTIFNLCSFEIGENQTFHLSTDMCPAHRHKVLGEVRQRLNNGLPILCVSTQLIEAGVDVDFGVVIRYLAGIDSIAQAAGRCNRNGHLKVGTVHIVNPCPEDENLSSLPDIAKGCEMAKRVLDDYAKEPARYDHNLFGPKALSDYYEYYFFQRKSEMDYSIPAKALGRDDTLANLLSENRISTDEFARRKGKAPDRLLNQSFMTAAKAFKAIDAPTQGIVVPYSEEGKEIIAQLHAAYDIELDVPLLRIAQQFTVNVYPHVLDNLKKAGAVKEAKPETRILTLDSRYYSPQFGISTDPVSTMETLYVNNK